MDHKKKAKAHKHAKPPQHAGESWQSKGWKQHLQHTSPPPLLPARVRNDDPELLMELLPLITTEGPGGDTTIALTEELMHSLVDNADLADEPEFQDLFFQPLESIETWATVAADNGIDPAALIAMPEDERADKQAELLAECAERLLSNEMRLDIVTRLTALRLRLKRSGKQIEAARVAALQSFLGMGSGESILPSTGLVQVILGRSLEAGVELAESLAQVVAADKVDDEAGLLERLKKSPIATAAKAILNRVPGLRNYIENQADKVWDEGQAALFEGQLFLEIYSDEEKRRALIFLTDTMGYDMSPGIPDKKRAPKKLAKDTQERVKDMLREYISEIMTQERLEQVRARMAVLEKTPSYDRKWLPFVSLMRGYMQDDDAVENELPFLRNALLGEILLNVQAKKETPR